MHMRNEQAWGYVLAGERRIAELVQTLQVNRERVIPTSVRLMPGLEVGAYSSRLIRPCTHSQPAAKGTRGTVLAPDEVLPLQRPSTQPIAGIVSVTEANRAIETQKAGDTDGWQVSKCLLHEIAPADSGVGSPSKIAFSSPETGPPSSDVSNASLEKRMPTSTAVTDPGSTSTRLEPATKQTGATEPAGDIHVVDDVRALERGAMQDHIVILLPKAVDKVCYLLRQLRCQILHGTGYLKEVVILTEGRGEDLEKQFQSYLGRDGSIAPRDMPADVYVVEGQPDKVSDLRRAGVETAYSCVLLADRSSVQEIDEEAVDEFVIHQFVTIEKLRSRMDTRRPLNYVVEVLSWPTLKILDQTYKTFKGKARKRRRHRSQSHFNDLRNRFSMLRGSSPLRHSAQRSLGRRQSPLSSGDPGQPVTYLQLSPRSKITAPSHFSAPHERNCRGDRLPNLSPGTLASLTVTDKPSVDFGVSHATLYPFVTAGTSFLIDVFDIISCQLFYNPDLIRFVDLLLALDPSANGSALMNGGGDGRHQRASGHALFGDDDQRDTFSGRLGRIPMPADMVGQVYGELFEALMVDFEAMPIALYRHDAKADVSYVFTGPPPETLLRVTDYVFFLAPIETMNLILRKFGPK